MAFLEKRILGRTGLEVGALSLGAAFATRGEEGFDGAKNIVFRVTAAIKRRLKTYRKRAVQ